MINKRYNEFLPSLQGSEDLMGQVNDVSKEIDVLKTCIDTEVSVGGIILAEMCFARHTYNCKKILCGTYLT